MNGVPRYRWVHRLACVWRESTRTVSRAVAALAVGLATCGAGVSTADQATPQGTTPCLHREGSLVPRLAMGVRRVGDTATDFLELRAAPNEGAPVVKRLDLFRPYYVCDKRDDPIRGSWLRLQDGYVAEPLGWAPASHLEQFGTRYGYVFTDEPNAPLVDLHDSSKDAYERLIGQVNGGSNGTEESVFIRQRRDSEPWSPSTIDDIVPFVELLRPPDPADRGYPDTTPTFRFGIDRENRLVHLGAVCGGPLDVKRLNELRSRVDSDAGLEMLFVIDETESMKPFFAGVASFIGVAAKTAAANAEATPPPRLKIAVSYYTDGPRGERVSAEQLEEVGDAAAAAEIASRVESHTDKLPPAAFANAPERMLEGIRDAVRKAGFSKGANAFVAVIGDTGHEPDPREDKVKLVVEVAELIAKHNLHVFFAHVGKRKTDAEMMFKEDAVAIRDLAVEKYGVPKDRIIYQTADAITLQQALEDARRRAEEVRRRTQAQIKCMETRNRHTEPGPKFQRQLEAAGLAREKYDREHLQFFVPARGWLYHPNAVAADGGDIPQVREMFFLAPPEKVALDSMLGAVQERLRTRRLPLDAAVIDVFAKSLADAARQPGLRERAIKLWNDIPEPQRSLGVYVENVLGLRIKSALPYAAVASADAPLSATEMESLAGRLSRLRTMVRAGDERFWFDSTY